MTPPEEYRAILPFLRAMKNPLPFYLKCFDKLLIPYTQGETKAQPVNPVSQKLEENRIFQTPKPGYLRPNPS